MAFCSKGEVARFGRVIWPHMMTRIRSFDCNERIQIRLKLLVVPSAIAPTLKRQLYECACDRPPVLILTVS